MTSEKRHNIISFMSYKQAMPTKIVAWLVILIFSFQTATYGYEKENISHLRAVRDAEKSAGIAFDTLPEIREETERESLNPVIRAVKAVFTRKHLDLFMEFLFCTLVAFHLHIQAYLLPIRFEFFLIILGPLIEELYYRKYILGRILTGRLKLSINKSILISSVFMALCHIGAPYDLVALSRVFLIFSLARVLASLYVTTTVLGTSIVAHGMWNFSAPFVFGALLSRLNTAAAGVLLFFLSFCLYKIGTKIYPRDKLIVERFKKEIRPDLEKPLWQLLLPISSKTEPSERMKSLGRRNAMDEDIELDLRARHDEFKRLTTYMDPEPVHGVKAWVVQADLGEETISYHFAPKGQSLIIVLNSSLDLLPEARDAVIDEGKFHEVREHHWMEQPGINNHMAHIIASAEQILKYSHGNKLTPYHELQLGIIRKDPGRWQALCNEYEDRKRSRAFHRDVLVRANVLHNARINLKRIDDYEALLYSEAAKPVKMNHTDIVEQILYLLGEKEGLGIRDGERLFIKGVGSEREEYNVKRLTRPGSQTRPLSEEPELVRRYAEYLTPFFKMWSEIGTGTLFKGGRGENLPNYLKLLGQDGDRRRHDISTLIDSVESQAASPPNSYLTWTEYQEPYIHAALRKKLEGLEPGTDGKYRLNLFFGGVSNGKEIEWALGSLRDSIEYFPHIKGNLTVSITGVDIKLDCLKIAEEHIARCRDLGAWDPSNFNVEFAFKWMNLKAMRQLRRLSDYDIDCLFLLNTFYLHAKVKPGSLLPRWKAEEYNVPLNAMIAKLKPGAYFFVENYADHHNRVPVTPDTRHVFKDYRLDMLSTGALGVQVSDTPWTGVFERIVKPPITRERREELLSSVDAVRNTIDGLEGVSVVQIADYLGTSDDDIRELNEELYQLVDGGYIRSFINATITEEQWSYRAGSGQSFIDDYKEGQEFFKDMERFVLSMEESAKRPVSKEMARAIAQDRGKIARFAYALADFCDYKLEGTIFNGVAMSTPILEGSFEKEAYRRDRDAFINIFGPLKKMPGLHPAKCIIARVRIMAEAMEALENLCRHEPRLRDEEEDTDKAFWKDVYCRNMQAGQAQFASCLAVARAVAHEIETGLVEEMLYLLGEKEDLGIVPISIKHADNKWQPTVRLSRFYTYREPLSEHNEAIRRCAEYLVPFYRKASEGDLIAHRDLYRRDTAEAAERMREDLSKFAVNIDKKAMTQTESFAWEESQGPYVRSALRRRLTELTPDINGRYNLRLYFGGVSNGKAMNWVLGQLKGMIKDVPHLVNNLDVHMIGADIRLECLMVTEEHVSEYSEGYQPEGFNLRLDFEWINLADIEQLENLRGRDIDILFFINIFYLHTFKEPQRSVRVYKWEKERYYKPLSIIIDSLKPGTYLIVENKVSAKGQAVNPDMDKTFTDERLCLLYPEDLGEAVLEAPWTGVFVKNETRSMALDDVREAITQHANGLSGLVGPKYAELVKGGNFKIRVNKKWAAAHSGEREIMQQWCDSVSEVSNEVEFDVIESKAVKWGQIEIARGRGGSRKSAVAELQGAEDIGYRVIGALNIIYAALHIPDIGHDIANYHTLMSFINREYFLLTGIEDYIDTSSYDQDTINNFIRHVRIVLPLMQRQGYDLRQEIDLAIETLRAL